MNDLVARRLPVLVFASMFAAPFLRISLPEAIRTGAVLEPLLYLVPAFIAYIIFKGNKFGATIQENRKQRRSFDVYLLLLFFTIIITSVVYVSFGVRTKSFEYSSTAVKYLYATTTQFRGLLLVSIMVQVALSKYSYAKDKRIAATAMAVTSFYLDAVTGYRGTLLTFYFIPFIFIIFIFRSPGSSAAFALLLSPLFILIFILVNPASQDVISALFRFDMSIPIEIVMHHNPVQVLEYYVLSNTYFPNVLRPIAALFFEMPETNPGRLISSAVGFTAEGSYYAISVYGEAYLNFGRQSLNSYVAVTLVFVAYLFLIRAASGIKVDSIRIAVVITLILNLFMHGIEDYFAVRFLSGAKILLSGLVLSLVFKAIYRASGLFDRHQLSKAV